MASNNQWASPIRSSENINPFLIAVLNFCLPGCGYLVLGQWDKAMQHMMMNYILSVTAGVLVYIYVGFLLYLILFIMAIFVALDAMHLAKRVQQGKPIMKGECAFMGSLLAKAFFIAKKSVVVFASDSSSAPEEYKTRFNTATMETV